MSVAEVTSCITSDAMIPDLEILKLEKVGCDSLDNTITREIGREPFLSFSKSGESYVQWIQLLHALDQQGSSTFSNGTMVDNCIEGKERGLDYFDGVDSFPSDMNLVKESALSLRSSGLPAKGTRSTSQQIQSLNIPESVVAFVQTAAKANGEPEKYLPGWPLLPPSKVKLQKCDKCSREFCSTINYRRHILVHRRALNIDKDSSLNRGLLCAFWDKLSLDDEKEILSLKNTALEEITGSSVIRTFTSLIRKPILFSLPELYMKAGMTLLDLVQARPARLPISSHELFNVLEDASENTFLSPGTALTMQKFVFDGETQKVAIEMKNLIACASFMLEQKLVKAWLTDKEIEALRCQKILVEEEAASQRRVAEILERKRLKKLRQRGQREKESPGTYQADLVCSPRDSEETTGSAGIPSPMSKSESLMNTTEVTSSEDRVCAETADSDENVDPQFQTGSGQREMIMSRWPPPNTRRNAQNGSYASYRDPKAVKSVNGNKVWTRKTKPEKKEEGMDDRERVDSERREQGTKQQLDQSDKCEVLIGSINVSLVGVNPSSVKLWRTVVHQYNEDIVTTPNDKSETELDPSCSETDACDPPDENRPYGVVDDSFSKSCKDSSMVLGTADHSGPVFLSRHVAEAFLAHRWKEAIAGDHVVLAMSPETETSGCLENCEDNPGETLLQSLDGSGQRISDSDLNLISGIGSAELAKAAPHKPNLAKPGKNYRVKYVPKQRNNG